MAILRTAKELEQAAFREKLSAEEDDFLFRHYLELARTETDVRNRAHLWKQCAFFAGRAFDKGLRGTESLEQYVPALKTAQELAPTASARRKLNEMKAVKAGKNPHEAALKRLARAGTAGNRSLLATDAQLAEVEAALKVTLPPSYRMYLKTCAHREVGTYQPYLCTELAEVVRDHWLRDLPQTLLPFLEDNADLFCFDLTTLPPEYAVVYQPHDGASEESWSGFAEWVTECWLAEL